MSAVCFHALAIIPCLRRFAECLYIVSHFNIARLYEQSMINFDEYFVNNIGITPYSLHCNTDYYGANAATILVYAEILIALANNILQITFRGAGKFLS
jgi:hypothetical protein